MRIEIVNPVEMKAFDIIHPATCFIPQLDRQEPGKPPARNVWFKFSAPLTDQAVNLYSGEVANIPSDTMCEPVDAKVVIE